MSHKRHPRHANEHRATSRNNGGRRQAFDGGAMARRAHRGSAVAVRANRRNTIGTIRVAAGIAKMGVRDVAVVAFLLGLVSLAAIWAQIVGV